MMFIDKIVMWINQLEFRVRLLLMVCIFFTPLAIYFHYNIPEPEEAVTLLQYFYGFIYRGGMLCLCLFFANFCRHAFQSNN